MKLRSHQLPDADGKRFPGKVSRLRLQRRDRQIDAAPAQTSLISGILLIAVGAMLATGQLTWLTRQ